MSSLLASSQGVSGAGRRVVAPYVTAWSEEHDPPVVMVERLKGGIGYRDETVSDRDRNGILWFRTPFRPGQGRPEFGRVHPLRQRRTMQRLLCQVCAGPADCTEDGVLWLLQDHRKDWPSWPDGMGVTEPPVCVPCVRMSLRLCPALRKGAVAVRAGSFMLAGVDGVLYRRSGHKLVVVGRETVAFTDPAIRWVRAAGLVRELRDCVLLPIADLVEE
ncbi:hypothetical protein [Actinophytocola sp.]|uniref:hypothetical protein n=1 Tax=Actinophytocola sp. TaxID=1872138 RepID=UPI00389A2D1F